MILGAAAVAGYGETEYHKDDQREPLEYIADAIETALDDAGLAHEDVDGLAISSHELHSENEITLGNHLGISGRWFLGGVGGNAGSVVGLLRGSTAIATGQADVVVVAAGDASTPESNMEMINEFNADIYKYMRPYGFGGANGLFALLQRRHMHEYGTTREQLGEIAITQREHAHRNPNAIFGDDRLTMDEYLNARPIVKPLHLFDCVLPCAGGGAVVLTSREHVQTLDTDPVYLRAGDEYHNPDPLSPFSTRTPFYFHDIFGKDLTHEEIDAVQLYDNYPIWVAMQMEDLGFCEIGNAGKYVEETDLSITGDLPLNTGGGQLSMGQANAGGGILHSIEAIRQLRGEGGDRQVSGCETVLTTGFGMVSYGGGLSSASVVFSNKTPQGGDD